MTCPCCTDARETDGLSRMYDSPRCIWCTARLIKRVRKLPRSTSNADARTEAILTDATAYGHNEKQIRQLVKDGPWLAPVSIKKKG